MPSAFDDVRGSCSGYPWPLPHWHRWHYISCRSNPPQVE